MGREGRTGDGAQELEALVFHLNQQGGIGLSQLTDLEFYLSFVMCISFSELIDVHFNLNSCVKVLGVY